MPETPRAKVFVSCGQREREMHVVREIEKRLNQEGYATYVTVAHNSVKAFRENIFRELSAAEYFLFIDFTREPILETGLDGTVRLCYRGSLFSHQELAIASFLEIEAIGFQQLGIRREGMLDSMQLNCTLFDDICGLPDLVVEKIHSLDWSTEWKAQLALDRSPRERGGSPDDQPYIYHVEVRNLHRRKPAINCTAYIQEIKRLGSNEVIPSEKFELKWAGTDVPYVTVMPGESRSFDAFYIEKSEPTSLKWEKFSHADTPKVCPVVQGPGQYELTYIVASLNFPVAFGTFTLDLGESLDEISPLSLNDGGMVGPHEPY